MTTAVRNHNAEIEHGKANIMKAEQNRGQHETDMRRAETIFIRSVIVILALTALAKLISASGGPRALDATDPLLMLTYRQLFLSVGMIELAIAAFLIFSSRQSLKVPVIAWLAANFTVYRVGLFWMGAKLPCSCLGTLTANLGISPHTADLWMKWVLAYLVLGSAFFLIGRAVGSRNSLQDRPDGMECPAECDTTTPRSV
jgi:hypothetical protein